MFNFCRSMFTVSSSFFCWMLGSVLLLNPAAAPAKDVSTLDACMDTFWQMYDETMREELGARFDVVECGKDGNMPYVLIGLTLLACEDALNQKTNFYVRGPEPKSYLPEYKIEKECSIQGPISCGEDWIMGTVVDIQLDGGGALGKWKKFVRDDVCELAMADLAEDQSPSVECPCWTQADIEALPMEESEAHCISGQGRLDIYQDGICEHSYSVVMGEDDELSCVTNRYDCPGLPDLGGYFLETSESEFASCQTQIVDRCEELGIDPPEYP